MLAVIETHPVQYHAPVYRALQTRLGVKVTAVYGSDFSVAGYKDREFGAAFAWDTDLLSGYTSIFLSRVSHGGGRNFEEVSAHRLGAILRKLAPDAVLVAGYSPRFYQIACYQAWRAGYPILFRGETTDHALRRTSIKALLRDCALRYAYDHFAKLLYIGERSYRHYKRLGCPEEKLIFSPYCVDVSSFESDEDARSRLRTASRYSLGIAGKQTALLFSGKLSPRKDPNILLHAIKQLPSDLRNNIVAVFLGSGELLENLKQLASQHPMVKVAFPGFQNQTALSRYYHAADLLILPSREEETWGLVVNEGLHHGLPCVVSKAVGCAPDLIVPGVTGHVFETGSAESLAAALLQAWELIGREKIRDQCRGKVSGYTVEEAANGIARAYGKMVRPFHSAASLA